MSTAKPLSYNEIRDRAVQFAARWRGETRENAEAQTFWNEWFAIFGLDRRRVVQFERKATRQSTRGRGRIDAFWEGQIAVEHKSAGRSLAEAEEQALDYLDSLSNAEQPRLVITSDFANFRVLDLEKDVTTEFALDELPAHIGQFAYLAGYETRTFKPEDAVNIKAAEMMGGVYDALADSGYSGHDLKVFLVRMMFLFFADDTGVWEKGLLTDFVETRTAEDGSDTGPLLERLFRVLDTPEGQRSRNLDAMLTRFPYVNGGLFRERIEIPDFDKELREKVLQCMAFDWSVVSPAIFGSLFQSVMDLDARRALGAHYTTEQNILKIVSALFLDDLRAEFERSKTSLRRLRALHDRLAQLTIFDPAAGSGNFLIIAYRELRRLELDILTSIEALTGSGQQHLDIQNISGLSRVNVDQFYAIEIEEFPARIAETAIYLVDHLANMELSKRFGQYFARIPLQAEAHIHIGNAIRMDWKDVLPAEKCSYILGNPPFVGMARLSREQQEDNRLAFSGLPGAARTGRLDYVACWYAKAIEYMRGTPIRAAFVSTNSITQGEQARALGPLLTASGYTIDFAHRTFKWTSEARGRAAVHVVVVGFSQDSSGRQKFIFEYPNSAAEPKVSAAKNINIYLADSDVVAISKHTTPLANVPKLTEGNRPQDGGGLIVLPEQREVILEKDPTAAKYLRRLIGSKGMLQGEERWCFWLAGADPRDIASSPTLRERMQVVRQARLDSPTPSAQARAATPSLFLAIRQPSSMWLCVPRHSSENRRYIPMAFYEPTEIAHDSTLTIDGADLYLFGILQSAMFMTWAWTVSGRLKSDIRLSPDLSYNSFPFPPKTPAAESKVAAAAQEVLDARSHYRSIPLGTLYSPTLMPPDLVQVHDTLDRLVDRLFGLRRPTDSERLAVLFQRYSELAAPLQSAKTPRAKATRKARQ
ncbi:class I SAM-dependent DNA methyltransferase [Micromonospora terminaliae]|uniref:site-specific DNA-methyltransferase (adenine-specific) n=1 Tax=Micromonospora terminaliae TaxID=1914461 RepID=A0AAJ3DHP8_9ACTN|nr:DNA methyltransferase [Micromonospora terminaliae]NES26283.1 class I SAM-dependent DNA methyltransferase [Micromonospora terminaliae]QGL50468.1 class I SAM-dependent DNA methyltransferase [Micromonospora terminaliae]